MRETYRGMSLSEKDLQQLIDDLKKGIGNMKGSASWSTDKDVSMGFSGSHIGQTSKSFGDKLKHKVVLITKPQQAFSRGQDSPASGKCWLHQSVVIVS